MSRNEQTSKRVASKAGKLLQQTKKVKKAAREILILIDLAESVAASALTQAPNRRRPS